LKKTKTKRQENKAHLISWKVELGFTVLMLALVAFFAYWQIVDHLRLRQEQKKIIRFLNNDISTALAGILNSQPRFGPIVLKESVKEKILHLMNSNTGSPLKGVRFFNSKNKIIFTLKQSKIPVNWHTEKQISKYPHLLISKPYTEIAEKSGLEGSLPVIGDKNTILAMINLISTSSKSESQSPLSKGGDQIGIKIKKILSENYFKNKTVSTVSYLLDINFLNKTISKDLILRTVSLLFSLIAFLVFTYSLFNLKRNTKLKILLTKEQEKNLHFQEMHLLAAGLAHEIKNPLNLVRGTTQSIAESIATPQNIRKKLAIVAEEVDSINTRLNSFIAYSNLKKPTPKKISCKQIIDNTITLLQVDADEKKINITVNMTDEQIWADEENLRQILFNLIHNAIKAVDEHGEITITSGQLNKNKIWVQIADNGAGIPENAVINIFDPYFTLDATGTGLGLAIVKQLAFNHTWKIKYTKNKPKGAIFRIEGIEKFTENLPHNDLQESL